jgi:hypothetical protein
MNCLQMIAEWHKGCTCATPGKPEECQECTRALIDALERRLKDPSGYTFTPLHEKIYTVTAYRWGIYDNESYPVGCYADVESAVAAAEAEEGSRGGKYGCEVLEWTVGVGLIGAYPFGDGSPVTVIRLPDAAV